MKVSIIVPVYNVEEYLKKCLDSLIYQTYKDIELIIVNDGTKDSSQKIIDKYKKKYPSIIKSYIKENGGLASARNYGIDKSNGDYVMFVDSDDYVDTFMVEKLVDVVKQKNSDIVVCNFYRVENDTFKEISSLYKVEYINTAELFIENNSFIGKYYPTELGQEQISKQVLLKFNN